MSNEAPKMVKQYLFVSNRTIVVRSPRGASLGFVRGEPTHVPPHMHSVVMEKGILPCDKDGNALDIEEATPSFVSDAAPRVLLPPEDPLERTKAIEATISAIISRNDPVDFTAGGTPHDKAISIALGWRVDSKEAKKVFQAMRSKE